MQEKVRTAGPYREEVERAVRILKEEGCSEVFLFGSGASGPVRDESDIDLAVRGCPKGRFFEVLGRLIWELDRTVDLVSLDSQDPFARYLQEETSLVRIG